METPEHGAQIKAEIQADLERKAATLDKILEAYNNGSLSNSQFLGRIHRILLDAGFDIIY